jgi:hypothetical protein
LRSIVRDAATSSAAPATAIRRAGPDSSSGASSIPSPPPLAAADPVNTNGRYGCASFHAGTAVCDNNTAVYDATPGATAAASRPAGRAAQPITRPTHVRRTRAGISSAAAARPAPGPYAPSSHVPMLIGELGFATRSM